MTEMISDDDKAGVPLPPLVEVTPHSPPLTITEGGPLPPEPPRPPITREGTLSGLQTGFASLTEDETRVAYLWLVGESLDDVCDELGLDEKTVRKIWQQMRGKLRVALEPKDEHHRSP